MNIENYISQVVKDAKTSSRAVASAGAIAKNAALNNIADGIIAATAVLKSENEKDVLAAQQAGLSEAIIDRLRLTDSRIKAMAEGVRQIVGLPDPVGQILSGHTRPNGLQIQKVRVPIGVIVIIYESRPNVTADAAALCLKAGNAVILRGGKESIHSNVAIYKILATALEKAGLDKRCIQIIEVVDREAVDYLLKADKYVDVVIPRGGESLIRAVVEKSTIPVIKHYKGVCHTYVDEFANLKLAEEVCFNAKAQRPATCNAMETMLVHEKVAPVFLASMAKRLKEAAVEIRGCDRTCAILRKSEATVNLTKATDEDFYNEYLDLILNVKVVNSLDDAMLHISNYGSSHSDAIITENVNHALKFTREVDSAAVYVNASTRFTDGFEFGMGAEIGISTDKLHARG
ncbi:MAG: glutamate-5-semialdehyde dehydrogenase, partial [Planctomycetota bacterium]